MKTQSVNFKDYLSQIIKTHKIKKGDVIEEMGFHYTAFARTFSGALKRATVITAAHAVNKLAGYTVLSVQEGLRAAGFDAEPSKETIAQTINSYVSEMPPSIQEDVLLIVEALYKKHVR